ncbi:MAG: pyridoxamine 5'-phosphate oxidase family protein [Desulfuromonadaceae bacterium]|nr:pyridoxamine 5'-phosphate oxidase family protein [Desulfuromonadaceae bacterium]MDD5105609.1 pyridoxamine 5'-phosphate oxidase family protein [Desulfuromonadaceae bacterium]
MNEQEARNLAASLMAIAETAIVTTIDGEGLPQTRAMLNLRNTKSFPSLTPLFSAHQSDFLVYFTTNTSSSKVAQIRLNKAVSIYYCLPIEWRGLMLGGKMEIVTDPVIKLALWQPGWEMYYPGGVVDPEYTILCFNPSAVTYYHQQNNFKLDLRQTS